ncbi:MAG TPA: type III-B CRISPR module RAMP protein Cmr6, partial [Verrucomicrobiae bacterium]|nr:type III-B CRISPR module RAMP protein Cmr6 [Verrucomicrobiae bacterium]
MIPIAKDVAGLVGEWAEGVENRSLLHEKFALPKVWGAKKEGKLNDAGRWSVLRIVTRGSDLLRGDSQKLRREAGGRNTRPDVAERKEDEAHVAEKMSNIAKVDSALPKIANENGRRFLQDVEKSFPGQVAIFEATLAARMMINLAGGVVENAGIALDRCFGLPLIPGSAVKGICRAQALWEVREADGEEKLRLLRLAMLLFGYGAHDLKRKGDFGWAGGNGQAEATAKIIDAKDSNFKGCGCFLPAYPTTPPVLVVDMVNPHYPAYYSGGKQQAEDNESPIPNYFPAVEAGSSFGFAVLLNRVPQFSDISSAALLKQARAWLERAVTRKGVGAKTAAGYGWFELGRKQTTPPASTMRQSRGASVPASQADQLIAR